MEIYTSPKTGAAEQLIMYTGFWRESLISLRVETFQASSSILELPIGIWKIDVLITNHVLNQLKWLL